MNGDPNFKQWCIVELMGHVRVAGLVTEEEHFSAKLGRIDIPMEDGTVTQWFGGASVYRITPTTEEIARAVAQANRPAPVQRWELPQIEAPRRPVVTDEDTERDDEDELDDEDAHCECCLTRLSSDGTCPDCDAL